MAKIYKIADDTTVNTSGNKGLPIVIAPVLTEENNTLATGYVLSGTIPLAGAAVELMQGTIPTAICYTDANGLFGIPFVPDGSSTYTARVFKPNTIPNS